MHACLCFEEEIRGERPEFTEKNSSEAMKLYFKQGRTKTNLSVATHSNSG